MNKQTILTVGKSILIILILLAVVFALRAPAADLPSMDNELKAQYVDSSGLPYFSEMDSYYNLRLTQDYADHGFVGDEIINGSEWDMHRYAPDGNQINYELGIVYLTNWLHDVANSFFGGNYSIKEIAFWTGCCNINYCSCSELFLTHIRRIFRYRYVLLHIFAVIRIFLC